MALVNRSSGICVKYCLRTKTPIRFFRHNWHINFAVVLFSHDSLDCAIWRRSDFSFFSPSSLFFTCTIRRTFFPSHSILVVTIPFFQTTTFALIKISLAWQFLMRNAKQDSQSHVLRLIVHGTVSYLLLFSATQLESTWYSDRTNWSNVNYIHELSHKVIPSVVWKCFVVQNASFFTLFFLQTCSRQSFPLKKNKL